MDNSMLLSIIIPAYNGQKELDAVMSVFQNEDCPADRVEIIVVDDGSDRPIQLDKNQKCQGNVMIIRNKANQGRSRTRNIGANHAKGRYLLFMDVDCLPVQGFIQQALRSIHNNEPLVFGHIHFVSEPFFEYFENKVQSDRAAAIDRWHLNQTTMCVMMERRIFHAVGGFDNRYTKYGMEDRDLFIRIRNKYPDIAATYSFSITVAHQGRHSVTNYMQKFMECGQYSIPIFSLQHPEEYRQMRYSVFDYQANAWLKWMPKSSLECLAELVFKVLWVGYNHVHNYKLKEFNLRLLKGVALLRGTLAAASDPGVDTGT
jgi:glycosyltransferase involved in cell wall biosynthesis